MKTSPQRCYSIRKTMGQGYGAETMSIFHYHVWMHRTMEIRSLGQYFSPVALGFSGYINP